MIFVVKFKKKIILHQIAYLYRNFNTMQDSIYYCSRNLLMYQWDNFSTQDAQTSPRIITYEGRLESKELLPLKSIY